MVEMVARSSSEAARSRRALLGGDAGVTKRLRQPGADAGLQLAGRFLREGDGHGGGGEPQRVVAQALPGMRSTMSVVLPVPAAASTSMLVPVERTMRFCGAPGPGA